MQLYRWKSKCHGTVRMIEPKLRVMYVYRRTVDALIRLRFARCLNSCGNKANSYNQILLDSRRMKPMKCADCQLNTWKQKRERFSSLQNLICFQENQRHWKDNKNWRKCGVISIFLSMWNVHNKAKWRKNYIAFVNETTCLGLRECGSRVNIIQGNFNIYAIQEWSSFNRLLIVTTIFQGFNFKILTYFSNFRI